MYTYKYIIVPFQHARAAYTPQTDPFWFDDMSAELIYIYI